MGTCFSGERSEIRGLKFAHFSDVLVHKNSSLSKTTLSVFVFTLSLVCTNDTNWIYTMHRYMFFESG